MLAAIGGAAWLIVVAALQPLAVEGAACIDAADVTQALVGLVPAGDGANGVVVELEARPQTLLVRVRRSAGGDLLTERSLPALSPGAASCRDRAQEIAVVVAAAIGTPQGPEPVAPPRPLPAAAPAAGVPAIAEVRSSGGAPPPRPFELGAALGTTLAAGSLAPAARVSGTRWLGPPLGLRLTVLADGEHTEVVGRGVAAWSRLGASGGLAIRSRPLIGQSVTFETSVALAAAVRTISGRGFLVGDRSRTFDPGLGLGGRLVWRGRRLGLWAGVDAAFWPRAQEVFVRNSDVRGELSGFDLFIGIGGELGAVTPRPDPT